MIEWDPTILCLELLEPSGTYYIILRYIYAPIAKLKCTYYECKNEDKCRHRDLVSAHILEDQELYASLQPVHQAKCRIENKYVLVCHSTKRVPFHPPIQCVMPLSPLFPDATNCLCEQPQEKTCTISEVPLFTYGAYLKVQGIGSLIY